MVSFHCHALKSHVHDFGVASFPATSSDFALSQENGVIWSSSFGRCLVFDMWVLQLVWFLGNDRNLHIDRVIGAHPTISHMIGCKSHNLVYAQPRKWFWNRLERTFDSCQDETDNLAESRPPDEGVEGRKWKENSGILAETTSDNVGWNRNWHNSSPWNEHMFWLLWGKTWCSSHQWFEDYLTVFVVGVVWIMNWGYGRSMLSPSFVTVTWFALHAMENL